MWLTTYLHSTSAELGPIRTQIGPEYPTDNNGATWYTRTLRVVAPFSWWVCFCLLTIMDSNILESSQPKLSERKNLICEGRNMTVFRLNDSIIKEFGLYYIAFNYWKLPIFLHIGVEGEHGYSECLLIFYPITPLPRHCQKSRHISLPARLSLKEPLEIWWGRGENDTPWAAGLCHQTRFVKKVLVGWRPASRSSFYIVKYRTTPHSEWKLTFQLWFLLVPVLLFRQSVQTCRQLMLASRTHGTAQKSKLRGSSLM